MDKIFLADLTTEEARRAAESQRTVVALLPVGAVEAHGPHAPLGTDTLISCGIAERAARALADDPRVRALVLPPLPWGVTRFAAGFHGSLGISPATLTALVTDIGMALLGDGFPRMAIVNSHFEPEHLEALRLAAQTLDRHGASIGMLEPTRRRNAERLTAEFRRGSCHAGQYETSLVLADRPELVDRDIASRLPALEVDMPARMQAGADHFTSMGMEAAYCGDPAQASAAEGEATFARLTELLLEVIDELAGDVVITYDDVPREFNVATHFVDRHLEEGRGARTALITASGAVSYGALAEHMNRTGNVLRDLGLRPEERVLILVDDGLEFVASWYGVLKIGGVTAEIYTFLAAKDIAYYLDYTRAAIAIVGAPALARFRAARADAGRYLREVLVVGAAPEDLRADERHYETLAAAAPATLDPAPTSRDDLAIWKFTTGSTGAPKACVHRMHSPLISAECYGQGVLGMRPDDVVLPVPKLFFGYARDMTALFPFLVGAAGIVYPERPTPERLFDLAERHRPTILVNVPTMMRAMVEAADGAPRDLRCLRLATSAGEALPAELHQRWLAAFGVEVLDGIGSSEAYHIYISSRPGAARPGSVGTAVPSYAAKVVGDDGREVPDGETGRLWVNAPTAAVMYFNDRAKSVRTYAGDLVMTGDLFSRDGDGYFSYRGRADELLKVGGIWVAPAEIEDSLRGHAGVADVAVVGYDDEGLQKPRAYVVVADGHDASPELASELQQHVRASLSPHKYPRDVRFLDALPKTGSGKIDRSRLRAAVT